MAGVAVSGLSVAVTLTPGAAHAAAGVGNTPIQAQCPQGGAGADGCGSAPANGSFRVPGAFALYARQSGQRWVNGHPWAWNAPGVDYPVGYSRNSALQNPATASLPHGCVYQPTGSTAGGPRVYCNTYNGAGVASPTIQGIDFSLNGCTTLEFSSNVSGTITVVNNNFKSGPNCAVTNGFLMKISGGHANLMFYYNQMDGNAALYPALLVSDIVDNTIDGGLTFAYNAIVNSPQIPITTPSYGSVSLKYNYINGWVMNPLVNEHGGVLMQGPPANASIPSTVYAYNTAITPAAATPSSGTATFTLSAPPGRHVDFVTSTIDHNVVIVNLAGGAGGAISTSAALAYINWGIYGHVNITNNYVDSTGARSCLQNVGGGFEVAGAVSGSTLTVSSVGTGALYAGAGFRTRATGPADATLKAYGSIDPHTHAPSTGRGGAGTYVLSGAPPVGAFSEGSTTNSPVSYLNEGGNISLVSGAPITGVGGAADGATCPPLY